MPLTVSDRREPYGHILFCKYEVDWKGHMAIVTQQAGTILLSIQVLTRFGLPRLATKSRPRLSKSLL
jgi:hypothetical protein